MNIEQIAESLEFEVEDVMMLIDMFIENSKESLDLGKQAIQTNGYEEIKDAAHAIKGSAANLMMDDISVLAQEIEQNASKKEDIDYKTLFEHLELKISALEELKVEV
jgi:HPt (histidine-containing phosphotransfer) domain-containing protein